MLGRGQLRCIGATTINEFRKYIEKDPALERRFQQVMVAEPSVVDTISILRGLRERCGMGQVRGSRSEDRGQRGLRATSRHRSRVCCQIEVVATRSAIGVWDIAEQFPERSWLSPCMAWDQHTSAALRCRYELHHGVRISDSALVDAAVLSSRYIADRFLPDKAIDLIDESAAKLKMEITSKPLALDEIDRKVRLRAVLITSIGGYNRLNVFTALISHANCGAIHRTCSHIQCCC